MSGAVALRRLAALCGGGVMRALFRVSAGRWSATVGRFKAGSFGDDDITLGVVFYCNRVRIICYGFSTSFKELAGTVVIVDEFFDCASKLGIHAAGFDKKRTPLLGRFDFDRLSKNGFGIDTFGSHGGFPSRLGLRISVRKTGRCVRMDFQKKTTNRRHGPPEKGTGPFAFRGPVPFSGLTRG